MFEVIADLQKIKNKYSLLNNSKHKESEAIKQEFLETKIYNAPAYSAAVTSKGALIDLPALTEQVSNLEIDKSSPQMIQDFRAQTLAEISFLMQFGQLSEGNVITEEVCEFNERMFGRPTTQEVESAVQFITQNPAQEVVKTHTYETLVEIFNQTLEQEGLINHGWSVTTKKSGPVSVKPISHEVTVPTSERYFSQQEIERLAIHEVTVHAFRRFNGELVEAATGLPLKNNWPSYLATEEGMASFIEIQSGYKDINTLRKYAARILAVDAAFNGESFNQIFDLLLSHKFDQSEAFDIVWRCFRRGGYLKDGEYWKGLHQIQQIHETTPERIKRLFAGKVNHEYFHMLEDKIPQELYDSLKLPVCLR